MKNLVLIICLMIIFINLNLKTYSQVALNKYIQVSYGPIEVPNSNPSFSIPANTFSLLHSSTNIVLTDGFHAESGSHFHAFIAPIDCQNDEFRIVKHQVINNRTFITQTSKVDLFNVSPNPSSGYIKISILEETVQGKSFYIYDAYGNLIYYLENISSKDNRVDISKFSKGVYFIKVEHVNRVQLKSVVLM